MQSRTRSKDTTQNPENVNVPVPVAVTRKPRRTQAEMQESKVLTAAKKIAALGKKEAELKEAIQKVAKMEQELRDNSKKTRKEAARPTPTPRKKKETFVAVNPQEGSALEGEGNKPEIIVDKDIEFQANFGRQPVPSTQAIILKVPGGRGHGVARGGVVVRGKVAHGIGGVVADEGGSISADGAGIGGTHRGTQSVRGGHGRGGRGGSHRSVEKSEEPLVSVRVRQY